MGLVRRADEVRPTTERRALGRTTDGLLVMLATGDAEQRRRAAGDLFGVAEALPDLLRARALESDPVVAEAVLTALTGHDCAEVGHALAQDLRSEDAALRSSAVTALQTLPIAVAALVDAGLLSDPDPDVRGLAVMVLSHLSHPDLLDWLRPVIETDPDATVVAAAVDVAVTIDGPLAAEFAGLATHRFPADPYLRFLAVQVSHS